MEKQEAKRVICVLTHNNYGVLARISSMFCRRSFNIIGIAADVTEDPTISRITITVSSDEKKLKQIIKQTEALQDVIEVRLLEEDERLEYELMMVKVAANQNNRNELREIADIYKAKIVDLTPVSMVMVITGKPRKIAGFMDMMRGYEILEVCRTGCTAMQRGPEHMTSVKDIVK